MKKIGFIGCGNMGTAMVRAFLSQDIFAPSEILASHKTQEGARKSQTELGIATTLDNRKVAEEAKLLFLAVKPQFYEEVLEDLSPALTPTHLLVGLAPGRRLAWLQEKSKVSVKTARMMPNTPALVGEGMTALCFGPNLSPQERDLLVSLAKSFGRTQVLPEGLMDAAGAAGGCSPAFVYMFIEAMADAAVREGMPRKMAYEFTAQAVLGSAKMVLETGRHPADLKDMVCSPGGTTIEGVRTLESLGFRSAVFEAIAASAEKGRGL